MGPLRPLQRGPCQRQGAQPVANSLETQIQQPAIAHNTHFEAARPVIRTRQPSPSTVLDISCGGSRPVLEDALKVLIRDLATHDELKACVELQEHAWGRGFRELVPPAMLMIPQKIGGITAGAFDATGELVGFVYGITGWRDGAPCHWSHMLAVHERCRDQDIGRQLKEYQRERLLESGVRVMYWTFDPLVARNAHVNLIKLGATVMEYVADLYGSNEQSTVDSVIGTDRFIVRWQLDRAHAPQLETRALAEAPLANILKPTTTDTPTNLDPLPDAREVHVVIPRDIQEIKLADPSLARRWRTNTRRVFEWYLGHGYHVAGFSGDRSSPEHFYHLSRDNARREHG